jgi:3-hydroxyisobutyrate dehydrogenase-like beta-hydroxyacid dehydrogenase
MKVAFIGLGSMGAGMARNLIKAGHSLTVYNRTRARAEEFGLLGARVAATPGEAASEAETLITMLADDSALEDCLLGPGRALQTLPADSVHIGMSTISVALSRRLDGAHREKKQHYVAAPVFGRPDAAEAAKLFVVAAGAPEQIHRCQDLFDAMGQKTFVVDENPASANIVKLAGNFLITTAIEGLAEAFAVVRKSKIEPEKFLEIMTSTLFGAPIFRNYGAMIAKGQFEPPGFKLPLGLKDNKLMLALGEEIAAPLPMANLVHDRFLAAIAQNLGNQDWSAISRISLRDAGLEKAA